MISLTACSPVPIFFFAYSPPQITLIKTMPFVLLGIVLLKSILFVFMCDFGKIRAFVLMALANLVSTVPGVIIGAAFMAPPIGPFIALGLMAVFALIAGGFFQDGFQQAGLNWVCRDQFVGGLLLLTLFAMFFVSAGVVSYLPEQYGEASNSQIMIYFVFKWGMMFAGLLVTILITIGFEGGLILTCAPNGYVNNRTIRAVVAANIWTFLIVFLIGAIIALPLRMRHPDFMLEPPS